MTGILFYDIHFPYFFGSTYASIIATGLVGRTSIISSIYVYINDPGMSHVATSLSYLALIIKGRNMDSVETVDKLFPSFALYNLLFIPYTPTLPLMFL